MTSFDERDLIRDFVDVGFVHVRLELHVTVARVAPSPDQVAWNLRQMPNPLTPSYEDTARSLLGEQADDHLREIEEVLVSQPQNAVQALALVSAVRT
jgi:hypothetical protein